MAKKGAQQQLQVDISTDEDLEKFIERPGLLVMDIYSEWCGPCLGMVGSLRKAKMEIGDNLSLAICKADTVTPFKRFAKKSEPSWLFVMNGKATNLMFGTNVPKLMKLINNELNAYNNKTVRHVYELSEPQPEEVERLRKKEGALAEAHRIEMAEKMKKRRDYLNYVTDTIMENLADIGVTMFGPHVNRDMYKKLVEPADALKIQCKDRRVATVTKEDFEVINYACRNPLDAEVIEQLDNKEVMLCYWKLPEGSTHGVSETLQMYAIELTKSETSKGDDGEERVTGPIISPMTVKYVVELKEGEEPQEGDEIEVTEIRPSKTQRKTAIGVVEEPVHDPIEERISGDADPMKADLADLAGLDLGDTAPVPPPVEEPPKKRTRTKSVKIPAVWVPNNNRTHAALIYVYFRTQTSTFLPPDPVPEPPHVLMAFDAYKKRDLINLAERHKDDVLLYGFFTSDDIEEAKYISSSEYVYNMKDHTPSDKIIFKVAKQTSHTMLSMATYGPSYVSPNTVIGRDEALKLFPANFRSANDEREEAELLELEKPKPEKPKKSSIKKDSVPSTDPPKQAKIVSPETAAAPKEAEVGESATKDDSGTQGEGKGDGEEASGVPAEDGGAATDAPPAPAEDSAPATEQPAKTD